MNNSDDFLSRAESIQDSIDDRLAIREAIKRKAFERGKKEGAIEALEGLIASATTKHEQDGVTMTWATSTKNEMLRAAEDMLAAIKADFSNPKE